MSGFSFGSLISQIPRNPFWKTVSMQTRITTSGQIHLTVLAPMDRRPEITMTEQPEPEERKRHFLRKEHPPYPGRDVGERIPYTPDNDILK